MASNDIKQKIVLEGEQEYKKALKDAQRELKTLRSELKAETAELGKNATEQQKAEARSKSLTKQIKEQEKIVETYKKALEEVKEKYGDDEDAVAKWTQKLNDARTTLANMKNDLDGLGNSVRAVESEAAMGTVAANSFADSFSKIGSIGSSVTGAIENVFSSAMEKTRALAEQIWELVAETAAKADAWGDLAGFYGSSAEEVQAWNRAIEGAGADFQQFLAFVNQLEFKGKDEKLIDWLGISDENYENKMEFAVLAMSRLREERDKLGAGKFNEKLGEVFGGKSAGVIELIGEWDRILEKRQEYEDKGFLLTDGQLSEMGEVDNQLHSIEEKWDMLKSKFAAGFGKVSLDIMTNVEGSLDALTKYFNAETEEEREEALNELHENILATFESIAQAIRDGMAILDGVAEELKKSEDPILAGIGQLLGLFVDAVTWLTEDNAKNLVSALEIIAGFWIAGNGLAFVAKIGELAGHIATIKTYNGLNGLLNGAGAAGAGAGAAGAGEAGAGASAGLGLTGLGGILGLVGLYASFDWARNQRLFHREQVLGTEENLTASTGGNKQLVDTFVEWVSLQDKMENLDFDATEAEVDELQAKINELWEKLQQEEEFNKMWDSYQAWREENGMTMFDWKVPDAEWWRPSGTDENGITHQDMANFNSMPDKTANAVGKAVGNIKVDMDGATVGRLVAPYVSQYIASNMNSFE